MRVHTKKFANLASESAGTTMPLALALFSCVQIASAFVLQAQSANAAPATETTGSTKSAEQPALQLEEIRKQVDGKSAQRKIDADTLKGYKAQLTKLIDSKEQTADAYYVRGVVSARLEDREGAVADFTKAIELNPKLGRAYWYRGVLTFGGAPKDALADFDAAIANGESTASVYSNRGSAHQRLGDQEAALKDFNEALKQNPDIFPARVMRAATYLLLKDYKSALNDANIVLEMPGLPAEILSDATKLKQIAIAKLAPQDKVISGSGSTAKIEEAIRPYVEQARKSLPTAKERFLKGLAKDETFYVTMKLKNPDGHFEQSFIKVESWKDKDIEGKLASTVSLPGHKAGEKVVLTEDDVLDWTIAHEDGTEEGNVVGKFLDTWKP